MQERLRNGNGRRDPQAQREESNTEITQREESYDERTHDPQR